MSNQWRRVVATLVNADQRRAFAEVILASDPELSSRRRERALAHLIEAGLVRATDDGHEVDVDSLTALLESDPPLARTGLERFVQGGRLVQYPAKPADRLVVLAWLADQVIVDGQELSEREVTLRLARHVEDPASFRRYLVDSGLLARETSGSIYRRAAEA